MRVRSLIVAGLCGLTVAVGGLAACAAGNAAGWSVPRRSLVQQGELLTGHVSIRIPPGAGHAVPTLVMFHGCGGLRQVQEDYAAAVLDAGYGVMIVGSNAARGIGRFAAMSQVCTALRLWGQERAADVHAAIAMAAADPRVDSANLALIGWSHGGWTILDALGFSGAGQRPAALEGEGVSLPDHVRAAILIYPYCGFPVRTDGRDLDPDIPVHAILAGNDVVAPAGDCMRLFERAGQAGVRVDYALWDGLTHAFDEPDQPPDPRMEYDADAAGRARKHLVEILGSAFDQG
jgi:dienelactone hydrolase